MKTRVLFIIESDPRTSPRPAEAIRIAAGLAAWQKVETLVYLRGPALRALGSGTEELADGDSFDAYLPGVAAKGRKIYVQDGAALPESGTDAGLPIERINDRQLAALAASSGCVTRF
jgi:hypothetical protein